MFRNYSLRRNKIGGVGMLGGRLAPVFFYKGLSAASQLFKRPSDCLKDDDYYCTQRHGDTEFYFEHRTHKNKGIDADKQNSQNLKTKNEGRGNEGTRGRRGENTFCSRRNIVKCNLALTLPRPPALSTSEGTKDEIKQPRSGA